MVRSRIPNTTNTQPPAYFCWIINNIVRLSSPDVPAIFEGAFVYDGIRIRVDILQRLSNDCWNMIEVKSASIAEKEEIRKDLLEYCGIDTLGMIMIRNELLKRTS
jgi:hypothetical protein